MTFKTKDQLPGGVLTHIQPERVRQEHLADIAALHYRVLFWSFNGQFGPGHIQELYEALYQSKQFFGYVIYINGRLLGFVTATSDYADTRRQIMGVFKRKIMKVLWVFIRHPRFFLTALESKFVVPLVFRWFGARAEWLTFVTDTTKAYISPFVALKLIEVLNNHFRNAGVRIYMAQGFKNNPKAMRYYEKLKWRVAAPLLMHNVYYYDTA